MNVELALQHPGAVCENITDRLYGKLSKGYTSGVSVLPLRYGFEQYLAAHSTARKRANRCARLGYKFVEDVDRPAHEDDIYDIDTSAEVRQGRPMDPAYWTKQTYRQNLMACPLHHVYMYGVTEAGALRAYTWVYRCGELALVSTILGHAGHLVNDVMYLLMTRAVEHQLGFGGIMAYNLHRSGTDGLRYFKERLGFSPTEVRWCLTR